MRVKVTIPVQIGASLTAGLTAEAGTFDFHDDNWAGLAEAIRSTSL